MNNLTELRKELSSVFKELQKDEVDVKKAKTLVAAGNSIMKTAKIQLEFSKLTGNNIKKDFFE